MAPFAQTGRSSISARINGIFTATSWTVKIHRASWLLLLLPALGPLFRADFFVSDDGRFHVYRIAALAEAWRQGVLHPRLFPDFGFGYGQAVLNFYSPLSYWPGAVLSVLGMNPAVAAQWVIGLAFILAALAAYGYIRSLWGHHAGVMAALVYTYLPYHLADAYTRGAFAEHFAFVFPPLILWAYTAGFRADTPRQARQAFLWGSLAWAGLVLTHNLSALLMASVFPIFLLYLTIWTRRWERIVFAIVSLLLAIGLTAGYWLPVILESHAIGISLGPSRGYENHFLPLSGAIMPSWIYRYRNDYGSGLIYPLSWLSLLLLGISIGIMFFRRRQLPPSPVHPPVLLFHLTLVLLAVTMMTAVSRPVWHLLTPLLGHLQYPWRFHALLAVGLLWPAAIVGHFLGRHIRSWLWMPAAAFLFASIALPALPLEPLRISAAHAWNPVLMWQEDAATGQIGATWTAEFLPLTVVEQRWAIGRPREDAVDGPPLMPPPRVAINKIGYAEIELQVESLNPFTLRLHQFAQPGWNAWVDGQPVPVQATGELGLVSIDIMAGMHNVRLAFGATLPRRIGSILALLSVAVWSTLAWREKRAFGLRLSAGALIVISLALTLNSLGLGQVQRTPHPIQAQIGDVALLVGYETAPARGEKGLDVTLYWFALRDIGQNFKVFVHMVDGAGQVIAQHDGDPVGGFTPTTRWRAGEIIADTHRIPLPPQLTPSTFVLKTGLYDPVTVVNLPTIPPTPDNRVDLGPVTLHSN